MPHEILSLRTLFLDGHDEATMDFDDVTLFAPKPEKNGPQVIYNFQHDLESVWWILMWTLIARVLYRPSSDFANMIFKNQTSLWHEREMCITQNITKTLTTYLEPSLHPFITPLETGRKIMLAQYVACAKATILFDLGAYRNIHRFFVSFFKEIQSIKPSNWRDMRLYTNEPQPLTLAVRSSSQPGGTSQLAADAPNIPQPGRNKRARMPGNAEYDPSESEESETQSEWVDSEDEKKGKGKKKKGTMSRKKPRTADVETGP
jgi:hypothetical protein